jgi:3-deoxy-manno-octulosonate cytidylyltransferase (CMP-KDO synthetase)
MLAWVYEAAIASGVADHVLVATPDAEIVEACRSFRAEAVLTRIDHPSGTDRIAEVSEQVKADVYVNVQGDEPLISPDSIRSCAQPLIGDAGISMGSVYSACDAAEIENPAVVKVVTDWENYALYFSRFPIPFPRNDRIGPVKKHVGIYAYRREILQEFSKWPLSPLEQAEGLEQLRFLENGVRIKMSLGQGSEMAVDTPEQAELVAARLRQR